MDTVQQSAREMDRLKCRGMTTEALEVNAKTTLSAKWREACRAELAFRRR